MKPRFAFSGVFIPASVLTGKVSPTAKAAWAWLRSYCGDTPRKPALLGLASFLGTDDPEPILSELENAGMLERIESPRRAWLPKEPPQNAASPHKTPKKGNPVTPTAYDSLSKMWARYCPHLGQPANATLNRIMMCENAVRINGLEGMGRCFRIIAASSFLSGRIGDKPWSADFSWALRPEKTERVLAGKYCTTPQEMRLYRQIMGEAHNGNDNKTTNEETNGKFE